MHMTQPSLSRSLKLIEWAVGSPLFDRSATGVTPTDQGRLLIRRARELVRIRPKPSCRRVLCGSFPTIRSCAFESSTLIGTTCSDD